MPRDLLRGRVPRYWFLSPAHIFEDLPSVETMNAALFGEVPFTGASPVDPVAGMRRCDRVSGSRCHAADRSRVFGWRGRMGTGRARSRRAFDGFLGSAWIRDGASSSRWHMVFRFETEQQLEAWNHSGIRRESVDRGDLYVETAELSPLTGWFDESLAPA